MNPLQFFIKLCIVERIFIYVGKILSNTMPKKGWCMASYLTSLNSILDSLKKNLMIKTKDKTLILKPELK